MSFKSFLLILMGLTLTSSAHSAAIQGLALIDTNSGKAVSQFNPIPNNSTIDLAKLGIKNISILAKPDSATRSVKFELDGNYSIIENNYPHALCNNQGDQLNPCPMLTSGVHTLKATPYSRANASGVAGRTTQIQFTIIRTPSPQPSPQPSPKPAPSSGVQGLALIDTDSGKAVSQFDPIPNNSTIDLAKLGIKNISILAKLDTVTRSVKFELDRNYSLIENNYPHVLCNNQGDQINPCSNLTSGVHTLKATPYSEANASGVAGPTVQIQFTIVRAVTPTPTQTPPPSSTCVQANPTVTLSPVNLTGVRGSSVTYTGTLTNNESAACTIALYDLELNLPSGFVGKANPSSGYLLSGKALSFTVTVTSPSTAADGNYAIRAEATRSGAGQFNSSASATYKIQSSPTPNPTSTAMPPPQFKTSVEWTVTGSLHDPNDPNTPLWNYDGYTYFVWVDMNRYPWVEKRKNGAVVEKALLDPTGYTAYTDAHHRFSMGIDQRGYIHIIGDMHNYTSRTTGNRVYPLYQNQQILYWKSNLPESVRGGFSFAGGKGASTALPGEGWISATARFFTDNNGELYYSTQIHAAEIGVSGKMGVGLFKYNIDKGTWSALGGLPDVVVSGANRFTALFWEKGGWGGGGNWFQNFQPSFKFDRLNRLHFAVSVNTDSSIDGANRVVYARSDDGGYHWKKANGKEIPGLPIRGIDGHPNQGDIVARDANQEEIGYFSPRVGVIVDKNGKPGIGVNNTWRTWDGTQWSKNNTQNFAGQLANFGYWTPDNNLVFISGADTKLQRTGSFDEKSYSYNIPIDSPHNGGIFSVDEYGLRTTGEIYGIIWDRGTRTQTILKTVISPAPLP